MNSGASAFRIDGKVAIVTGGGSGIGKACAEALAAAGGHVVVAGRSEGRLRQVADAIRGEAVVTDVTDYQQVVALFERARAHSGRIDILVNNAGGPGPIAPLADVDLAAFRTCLEVNLMGAMHCLKVAARVMATEGAGAIINMSSRMGIQGQPHRSAYCASKFALIGLSEALARELGPTGVRVNAVVPGGVAGDNLDQILVRRAELEGRSVSAIAQASFIDAAALRRWVEPEDVASAVIFLASDAASAITGQRIVVDCGRF